MSKGIHAKRKIKTKKERKRFVGDGALTKREAEIFARLASGLDVQTIAGELRIGNSTAYTLCRRMILKLGVKNLHDLEILAVRRGSRPRNER